MHPKISIIIATFNSSRNLSSVLESIKKQTFPKKEVEILIIDGGSIDKTLDVAKEYRCKIFHNPKIEPVSAKLLGYKKAKGDYLIYLDADEVIENVNSLYLKYTVFQKNKEVKGVIGSGYKNPPNASFLTSYINEFGDPFSFFIYRLSKNSSRYYDELKKRFPILKENSSSVIFDFSYKGQNLLQELGAMNSMIDLKYFKKEFPVFTTEIFAHMFQLLISRSKAIGMTKNDPIIHHATSDLRGYINKISWRIKNNIYHLSNIGISGFIGREQFHSSTMRIKKYFFIPYAFSLIFPLSDAIWLSFSRKNILYILYLPLVILSASMIIWYYLLRLVGIKMKLRSYDESKEVK